MKTMDARWAVTLLFAPSALVAAHAGCNSVYDEYYRPLTEAGGGGPGVGGGAAGASGAGGAGPGGSGGMAGAGSGDCGPGCCTVAEDCLDPNNPCAERTCEGGACGTQNLEGGTALEVSMQVVGDCKVLVCDGAGATQLEDDDADPPDDGVDCTTDLCEAGAPTTAPAPEGTPCDDGGGSVCNALAECVQCNADADCASDAHCVGTFCVAKLADGAPCAENIECASDICDGVGGVCCDAVCAGPCRSCHLAGQEGQCSDIPALVDPEDDCPGTTVCDGAGACKKPSGEACLVAAECANGTCVDGFCCAAACAGLCRACNLPGTEGVCELIPKGQDPKDECWGASTCDGLGECLSLNGQPCVSGAQCQSGACVDGLCCDVACTGLCRACDLPASPGTCTFIPAGTDPDNDCPGSLKSCDGQGACGGP
jgi:hypothetical protein